MVAMNTGDTIYLRERWAPNAPILQGLVESISDGRALVSTRCMGQFVVQPDGTTKDGMVVVNSPDAAAQRLWSALRGDVERILNTSPQGMPETVQAISKLHNLVDNYYQWNCV